MPHLGIGIFALCMIASAQGLQPEMSQEQRDYAVKLLETSQKEFVQLVQGLTDEQWSWKPVPERWSVGECAEHIMLTEGLLMGQVKAALASPPNPEWEKKTAGKREFIEKVMAPRLGKAQAPEPLVPHQVLSRAEIMKRYAEGRAQTLEFAEATTATMNDHTAEHPFPVFNTLSAFHWLIYVPLHNMRHDKQIEEVMATAGFPK